MKQKHQRCESCGEETIHSIKKVISPTRGRTKREVTHCNQCGRKIIKTSKRGTYTISGKNERGKDND